MPDLTILLLGKGLANKQANTHCFSYLRECLLNQSQVLKEKGIRPFQLE